MRRPPVESQGKAARGKGFLDRFIQGWETTVGVTTIQRRHALRTMLVRAEASRTAGEAGSPWSPWESVASVASTDEHFDGEDDVLAELHQEWVRLLSARLHRGQIVARRTPLNVRDLYDELCGEHATMRTILDAHHAHPALWEPTAREHGLLARIAGLVPDDAPWEQAASQGRALVMQRIPVQRGALR